MQKSVGLIYTISEHPKMETKETIPFTVAYKIIKYPGIVLKGGERSYTENHTPLLRQGRPR